MTLHRGRLRAEYYPKYRPILQLHFAAQLRPQRATGLTSSSGVGIARRLGLASSALWPIVRPEL